MAEKVKDKFDDFDPRKLTPEEMDEFSINLKNYLFTNWKTMDGISKYGIRGKMQDAMKARKGGGNIPKEKLKENTLISGFAPEDFTKEEQDSLQVGLRDFVVKEWGNFSFITKPKLIKIARQAAAWKAKQDIENAKKKETVPTTGELKKPQEVTPTSATKKTAPIMAAVKPEEEATE